MHSHDYTHRDLKLENILLESNQQDAEVILADFSLATKALSTNVLKDFCGTISYMAPELFQNNYTRMCDLWSCGVLMFIMITGF